MSTSATPVADRVQDELARAIASALSVRLAATDGVGRQGTESVEAHDLVLRARYLSNVYTGASLRQAIAYYGQAIALDSTLADAHSQHASLLGYYDRNYRAADQEYVRALAFDSTLSGASADYANILTATGHADSAAAVLNRALRIDPLSPYLAFWAPLNFTYAGRRADASAACAAAGDVSAALGHRCRVNLLFAEGHYTDMIDTLRRDADRSPWAHAQLAAALARHGSVSEARREASVVEAAARDHYLDERVPAQMYAAMGDADRALAWLERGFASNAAILAYMNVDDRLAPLRTEPRFQAMLRRAGLR